MVMTWNGPRFVAAIEARGKRAVAKVAASILVRAQAECPVDTGALKASGHVLPDPDGLRTYVIFDMPYAAPVHYGNGRNTPNPWLGRAVMAEKADAYQTFQSVVMAGMGV